MENNANILNEIVTQRRSVRLYEQNITYDKNIVQRSLQRAILSPNSSNMQLWEFYRITSKQAKNKIAEYCMKQTAATTANELVIFIARPDKYKKSIKRNLEEINSPENPEQEKSKIRRKKYYSKLMPLFYSNDFLFIKSIFKKIFIFFIGLKKPTVREVGANNKKITIHKSIALAAQTFMLSVKSEGYDTCPMEGFDSKRIKKFLKLPRKAQINMIISVGKGKNPEGIFYPRWRYKYNEIVKEI